MTVQTIEELVSCIELNKARRKSRLLLSFALITVFTLVLIWSTDVPDWLADISPYICLQFILMALAYLWVLGDAQKNEELLRSKLPCAPCTGVRCHG